MLYLDVSVKQFYVENIRTVYGEKDKVLTYVNLTPCTFWMFRECQVKKGRKERLACLVYRYYFYSF